MRKIINFLDSLSVNQFLVITMLWSIVVIETGIIIALSVHL